MSADSYLLVSLWEQKVEGETYNELTTLVIDILL